MKQYDVLEEIMKHTDGPFSIVEVAKSAKTNRETVRQVLKRLRHAELVVRADTAYHYRHWRLTSKFFQVPFKEVWECYEEALLVERQLERIYKDGRT